MIWNDDDEMILENRRALNNQFKMTPQQLIVVCCG